MTNKLNVLVGADNFFPNFDGVIQTMHNYLKELNKDNIAYSMAPKLGKKHTGNLPYKTFWCKSVYLPIHHEYCPIPQYDTKFKKQLEALDLDIIHIHSPFTMCSYATKLARKKDIPMIVTFHTKYRESTLAETKSKLLTNAICKVIGKNLNKADEVFIANESMLDELRSYGYKGKVSIMPLGTEWEKIGKSQTAKDLVNKTYNLDASELVFLSVGRLETVKNTDFTIRALKRLKEYGYSFRYIIAGKGPELENLQKLVADCNLTENVIFTGFIERDLLKALYSRGDVLLFPSSFDTFGLVKVEAAAFDTPTLTLKNSCAGYGITDNENGYLIENDLDDYVQKLKFIIAHKDEIARIGKNAGETLYFNWESATQCLINKYREIIANYEPKTRLSKTSKAKNR